RSLESLPLSDADQQEIGRLIRIAAGDARRSSHAFSLELGFGATTNANDWPTADRVTRGNGETLPAPVSVYGGSRAYSDTRAHLRLGLDGTFRFDAIDTSAFYAVTVAATRPDRTVESEGQTVSVSTGIRHHLDATVLSLGLGHSRADRVNTYGADALPVTTDVAARSVFARVDTRLRGDHLLAYRISRGREDHSGLPDADNSDADRTTHRLTWHAPIGADAFTAVRVTRSRSRARLSTVPARRVSDRDRTAVAVSWGTRLGDAQRVEVGGSLGVTTFPRQRIADSKREDRERTLSLLYGHQLGGISDHLAGWEMVLETAYRDTESNQSLAEVNEITGMLTLKREWAF
ncbi:MAG: hypothetical protein OXC91_06655, partial [Rhodobacteraceae bacterium]|nr:hypothetical protein [Paracoccaceae bacterium]